MVSISFSTTSILEGLDEIKGFAKYSTTSFWISSSSYTSEPLSCSNQLIVIVDFVILADA